MRGGSHAQESEDGKDDTAIEPVVMDGSGALPEDGQVWFVGLHC